MSADVDTASAYATARAAAERVASYFRHHHEMAAAQGRRDGAPLPDAGDIESIANAGFWASLRREEGLSPRISLAFLPPALTRQPMTFERWLPLAPVALAKLAPAVERPGIHLGVWRDGDGALGVWGVTRHLPPLCFVLEVVASGLLVIKHRGEAFGKFVNVAVLEGDQMKIVDETDARVPDCPGVVASLLGVDVPSMRADSANALVQIAASMRLHGRGGALLVVPASNSTWEESILTPVLYSVSPPFPELAALLRAAEPTRAEQDWQEDMRRAVEGLAGLTAVDGATLITDAYELVAFGAKITRRRGSPAVERMLVTEPVEGSPRLIVTPYQLGGTRHLSAAQFVNDQRDTLALVASQDGRFTIFSWSACEDIVHAHRVETLLL